MSRKTPETTSLITLNIDMSSNMKNTLKIASLLYLGLILTTFACILGADLSESNSWASESAFRYAAFGGVWGVFGGSAIMLIMGYLSNFLRSPFTNFSRVMFIISHPILLFFILLITSKVGQLNLIP
jgi:hypothetical protein